MKNNIEKIVHDKLRSYLNEQLLSNTKTAVNKGTEKIKKALTPEQKSGLPDWVKNYPCLSDRGTMVKVKDRDDRVAFILQKSNQYFYKNMRFFNYDKSNKELGRGSWECKDGKLVITADDGDQWTKDSGWVEKPKTNTTNTGSTINSSGTTKNTEIKKVSKYKKCSEELPIKQWCKNNTIKRVQACLKMPKRYQTGNFGPITQEYLESRDQNGTSITTETIINICGKNDPLATGGGTAGGGTAGGGTAGGGTAGGGTAGGGTARGSSNTGYEGYTFDEIETDAPTTTKRVLPSSEKPEGEGTGYEGYSDETTAPTTNQKSTPPVSSDIKGLQSSKKSFTNPMGADYNEG